MSLNDTLDKMDMRDVHRMFYSTTEYTFFSSTYGTLSRIHHMLGYKIGLNKLEKTEIIPCYSDHDAMKLEIKHKKKNWKKEICCPQNTLQSLSPGRML